MARNVLITGGASGLGAAVLDAVLDSGAKPHVLDLHEPAIDVPHARVDLADTVAAERATRQLIDDAGGVDAVVTAAGMDVPGALSDLDTGTWERVVRVNLLGTAAVVRAALPALTDAHGRIVTVSSTLGLRAVPDATAYCAAKFGVVGFTRALAAELAGRVDVTLLVPGGMRTHFFDGRDARYRPGPDAALNDPAAVARAVLQALQAPVGCVLRELVVCADTEPSYP